MVAHSRILAFGMSNM